MAARRAFDTSNLTAFAYLCSSLNSIAKLVAISKRFSKKDRFVLLLKNDEKVLDYLLPAYLNAYLRYSEGSMRSKSLAMEVLLFAARTMRLDKAIKDYGAMSPDEFIVFSNDRKAARRFMKEAKADCKELRLSFNKSKALEVVSTGLFEG